MVGAGGATPSCCVVRDHKSLLAWQEAHVIVHAVMLKTRATRHPCVDQLQRAALSVPLNIAEGYAFKSARRFRNHLDIAYASAVETADLLELCRELGLLEADVASMALTKCHRCQQLVRGLINRLRGE